jgi:hypothetical protein
MPVIAQKKLQNHVVYILDRSGSMSHLRSDVIKVTDKLISDLADISKTMDQETRVTIYGFGDTAECLVYDTDVLRLPSISGLYQISGMTALADAVTLGINDLRMTPEKYGDHSFLIQVVTDGQENASSEESKRNLPYLIKGLPGHWTLAGFVPSVNGKHYLQNLGFPQGNISIWDPYEEDSVEKVGQVSRAATTQYMTGRASGQRSTTSLYSMAAPDVKDLTSALTPLTPGSYWFETVMPEDLARIDNGRIDEFMQLKTGQPYFPGRTYYQMTKRERIQPNKKIAVAAYAKKKDPWDAPVWDVYVGEAARTALGLPAASMNQEVRVSPGRFRGYEVYVLSTSMNRKLHAGSRVLTMR